MSLFPTQTRRRRRRHGRRRTSTTAIVRTPEQLRAEPRRLRVGMPELLACAAVTVVCGALIALIWIATSRAIQSQTDETQARVERFLNAEAEIFSDQVRRELGVIDQSVAVLQSLWDADPTSFDLAKLKQMMPALMETSDDVFIANSRHIIVQDIMPAAIGQGIGSGYVRFANGSLERIGGEGAKAVVDRTMLVGELGAGTVMRQYVMYLVRPLAKSDGWVIGASYRSSALVDLFTRAKLGKSGLAALIDTHRGGVQAVAGVAALRPQFKVGESPFYKAAQEHPDGGVWIGRNPIDGVTRIQSFRHVADRDLLVVVGMERGEAMAPAQSWAIGARATASLATALVLGIGGIVLWELWHLASNTRRRRAHAQTRVQLEAARDDLRHTRVRANVSAAQVRAVLELTGSGIAVFDHDLRLTQWNPGFVAVCGLSADALHEGLLLDELLRLQAMAGRFGALEDVDAEVERRMLLLRADPGPSEITDGVAEQAITTRAHPIADGGLVLAAYRSGTAPVRHAEPEATGDTVEL